MDIQTEEVRKDPLTGSKEVVRTTERVPSEAAVDAAEANRINSIIWYIAGLVNTLLALRILFLLFGAANTGFTSLLYSITAPLVAPFRGIFTSPGVETGYFDTAALLAMIIYSLLAWGIASLIDISRRNRA